MYRFEDMFVAEEPEGQIQAVNERLVIIGQCARKCLSNGDFQQYKELFEKEKDAIMNAMVIYTTNFGKNGNENIEMYAFNMMRFVQQITDLRKLLTAVEIDSRKGKIMEKDNGKD